jgi:hypothetical protein
MGNLPGSWHDADLTRNLATILRDDNLHPRPFCIAGDSAFPAGVDLLGRIRCVLKMDSDSVRNALALMDHPTRQEKLLLNASLTSVRARV